MIAECEVRSAKLVKAATRAFAIPRRRQVRRGATAVEFAIIALTFLYLILGIIDMGIAVMQYNSVAEAARTGARQAIVHGNTAQGDSLYPRKTTTWGPTSVTTTGNDGSEISNAIRPYFGGMDATKVTITLTWPNSTNSQDDPVTCKVSTTYMPMTTAIFGKLTINLSSSSTMRIAY
jgi:Flp pilus assembly protein TadG